MLGFGRGRIGNRAFLDDGQQLLAGDRVAFLELDFLQHAVGGSGHFENDLVGFQIQQVLVALDRIAHLLVPGGDGGVGDGFGKDWNFDFGGHVGVLMYVGQ